LIYMDGQWVYEDTREHFDDSRPCKRCGRFPTMEGYDACLGYIPGIVSACCGHGVTEPYSIKERKDGKTSKDRLEKEGVERRGDA